MRKAMLVFVTGCLMTIVAWPAGVGAQGRPSVRITTPSDGAKLTTPRVEVRVQVENFKTVDGGTEVRPGEGHVHLLVDHEPPAAGEAVPQGEGYVHLGAAPYDTRSVDLTPGQHRITAVLGDSAHRVLDPPATHSITVTVEGGAQQPPTRPAATGDGSLADPSPPVVAVAALGIALLALARRFVRS